MPIYNYKCSKCGHTFQNISGFDDPCPPCPCEVGLPHYDHHLQGPYWKGAEKALEEGLTACPWMAAPTEELVNPCTHEVAMILGVGPEDRRCETHTIEEWLKRRRPCGGKTFKLISRSSFQLKGSGWADTGYS